MSYGVKFRSNFRDFFGKDCRIDILKRSYSGAITEFTSGKDPVIITYKNDSEDKFNPISGSGATISIITSESLSLKDFYTGDEREFLVKIYYDGSLHYSGFVVPDDSNEPFLAFPYEASLKCTDVIGTLKNISYTDDSGLVIKKVDSFKNILGECLRKTGLDLDYVIGVNIFEAGMTESSDPLAQAYIDTNRFIDNNGKAYSVYEVIKSISTQFTATLKQIKGAFWLVNIGEIGTSNRAVKYSYLGNFVSNTTISGGVKLVGSNRPVILANKDHSLRFEKAYKAVVTYYQFGYFSNKLLNGDFNKISPSPQYGFESWTPVNGMLNSYSDYGVGQKRAWVPNPNYNQNLPRTDTDKEPGTGTNPLSVYQYIPDYYLILTNNAGNSKGLRSDPIPVRITDTTLGLSIDFQWAYAKSDKAVQDQYITQVSSLTSTYQVVMTIKLGSYYFNGSAWVTAPSKVSFTMNIKEFTDGKSIQTTLPRPIVDGDLTIEFNYTSKTGSGSQPHTAIDNISLSIQENQYAKAPKGFVDTLVQTGSYTGIYDPAILLFGDSTNDKRTDWIRLQSGTATRSWHRKNKIDNITIQRIATQTILNNYYKVSKIFEGTLLGSDLNALDTYQINLVDGVFLVSSGSYNLKTAQATLNLIEYFTDDVASTADSYEDFGDYKKPNGSSIGSGSGVSVTTPGLTNYPTLQDITTEGSITDKVITVKGLITEESGSLVLPELFDIAQIPANRWGIFIDNSEGGSATPPTIIDSLDDLNDVTLTSPTNQQALVFDGTKWVNADVNLDLESQKNIPNGIAGLTSAGLLPSSIMPSYVDDVIEGTSLANLPATGEAGKIYVTTDNNKSYRWSGSTYVEIQASPGSTDAVPEGSVNKYFTDARARNAVGADVNANANTVVQRDGNGDIKAREFVLESQTVHGILPSAMVGIYPATSQIVRFNQIAVRQFLGMPTGGDTLQSVTDRGATTTKEITVVGLRAESRMSIPNAAPALADMEEGRWYIWIEE